MLVKIICKTLLYFVMNVVDNMLLSDSLQSQLKVKWLLTQGVINHVKTVINGLTLLRRSHTTAARQGGFIVPYVWEIVVRKHVTNFEGCHFARFYILIWWRLRQRVSTRAHAFSNLLSWERYHLLHISLTEFTLEEIRRLQQSFVVFLLENAS